MNTRRINLPAFNSRVLTYSILLLVVCISITESAAGQSDEVLIKSVAVLVDSTCNFSVDESIGLLLSSETTHSFEELRGFALTGNVCYWSKITLTNNASQVQIRYLYFSRGWQLLTCYKPNGNKGYDEIFVGLNTSSNALKVQMLPGEKSVVFVRYPEISKANFPSLNVREFSETEYMLRYASVKYKYLIYGFLAFPLLFFLAQFVVERDYLNFYYLVFLVGSSLNLVTILESIPFFELSTRLIKETRTLQIIFLFSIFLTLSGLIKYIHKLFDLRAKSARLVNFGNYLLALLLVIILVPLIFQTLLSIQHYENYLQYFRVCALAILIYILALCIYSMIIRVRYSGVLLLAFLPLIASAVFYAFAFILNRGYSNSGEESFVLIFGYFITVLLFGVILGVRNKTIKGEKIMYEEQTRNLRELDRFKSRFYTNFTHEFRTPLTVISGTADMIKNNEQQKQLIQRNSKRLLKTVNELLELSKLESETLKVDWVQGDIIPYLKYLLESCSSLAEAKQITLLFHSIPDSFVMDYDSSKLQKIVINLLSNAIKFTPKGGSVDMKVIEESENGSHFMVLVVRDTGIGIPSSQLSRIFDRFYQVDESESRPEGTGIGLALAQELSQTLGGSIKVESEIQKGSTFYLRLPVHRHATEISEFDHAITKNTSLPEQSPGVISPPENQSSRKLNGFPTVLVIEDNPDVTTYIFSCLDSHYELRKAPDGRIGLEKAFNIIPDVIICDVMMPELDGYEVCKRLKEDRRTSHIPVLILTAKSTQEDKLKGLSQGADAYLTKPFDREELLIRLSNLSEVSKKLRENIKVSLDLDELKQIKDEREAQFIKELDQIISENLQDETFETNKLCREIGMSRTQLHRKLSAIVGTSTARYIKWFRMRHAKRLLTTTDHTVGEIVVRVGFKTFSHFSRTFSDHFGYPPSTIRKE